MKFFLVHRWVPSDREFAIADRGGDRLEFLQYDMFSSRKPDATPMIDAAIIGLGRWGKSIVSAVQGKSKRLHFIRGVSKEPDQVRDFAGTHGFKLSTEFEEAVADPRVQAVVLATPHSAHVDQIVAVAAAGKPVWCEKPLALTRAQAERAVAACAKARVVFGLGNNKRCFSSMSKLKQIVSDGTLGEVLHIEGHFCNEHSTRVTGGWRDDPREAPGGGMTGAGLHVLDAFVNLGGPVTAVDARLFVRKPAPDPRDSVAVLVKFESGATGLLATVRAAPMYWRIHVFGTKGWAEARDETMLTVARIGEKPETETFPQVDSLAVLLEAFAESIETGKPFPVSTTDMLDVVGAFEAIIRSMSDGCPVAVKRG
jgi:predicted dehydrogenase